MTFCENKRHLIDYCLTNNDLEYTYRRIKDIVRVEFPFITFPGDSEFNAVHEDDENDGGIGELEKKNEKERKESEKSSKKEAKKTEKTKKGGAKAEL